MKRTFFAIPVIAQERRLLQEVIQPIAEQCDDQIHWIPEKKWHLTVRFLGNANEEALAYFAQRGAEIARAIKKFSIHINKIAGFPSPHARIIAAHVAAQDIVQCLFNTLNEAALTAGLPGENHTFRPHITLAKFDNHVCHVEPIILEQFTLHAQELVLFQSKPNEPGSEYIPLQTFRFHK